jgi:hypothetical protein
MMRRIMGAAIALCVASGANAATLRLKSYIAPEDEKQRILNAVYLDGLKDGLQRRSSPCRRGAIVLPAAGVGAYTRTSR